MFIFRFSISKPKLSIDPRPKYSSNTPRKIETAEQPMKPTATGSPVKPNKFKKLTRTKLTTYPPMAITTGN